MKKSLLIINGATHANGNTEILFERVIAGARESNSRLCGDDKCAGSSTYIRLLSSLNTEVNV